MRRTVGLVALALITGAATAQSSPHNDTGMEPLVSAATPASAGLRVRIDPNTHEITSGPPDRAQRERTSHKLALVPRNDDLMWVERRADGSEFLHTEGQILMNATVRPDGNGGFEQTCLPGAESGHRHTGSTP